MADDQPSDQTIDVTVQTQFDALTAGLTLSEEGIFLPRLTPLLHIGHLVHALGSASAVELLQTGAIEWVWFKPRGLNGLYACVSSISRYVAADLSTHLAQQWTSDKPRHLYVRLCDARVKYRKQNLIGGKTPVFYFTGNNILRPLSASTAPKTESKAGSQKAEPERKKKQHGGGDGQYVAVRTYLEGATVNGRLIPRERYGEFFRAIDAKYGIRPVAMNNDPKGPKEYLTMSDVQRLEQEGITPPQIDPRAILVQGRAPSSDKSGSFPRFGERGRS